MKYALRFFNNSEVINKVDEIIIKYNRKTTCLIDYVKRHPSHRIIADVTELDNISDNLSIFKAAHQENKEFTILLSQKQSLILPDLFDLHLQYFFIEGAGTWDNLISQLNSAVSDVYIINELAFDMARVSDKCHNNGVRVRVFPNVAQSSASSVRNLDTLKYFFIPPEGIKLYEKYVDICEFFGTIEKQDALYKIYRDGVWPDNLKHLILGLDTNICGDTIAPGWLERRVTCQKKCNYGLCHMCDIALELGNKMEKEKLHFNNDKVDNTNTILNYYEDSFDVSEDYTK